MKKYLLKLAGMLVMSLPLAFTSCEMKSDMEIPLGVDTEALVLGQEGCSTNFTIYSTMDWNVKLSKPVEWMSLSALRGHGKGNVEISTPPNYGVVRCVDLLILGGGDTLTVKLTQKGEGVIFNFKEKVRIGKEAQSLKAVFENNLREELQYVQDSVAYKKYIFPDEDDEDVAEPETAWISGVKLTKDGFLEANITENTGTRPRKAEIWLIYMDANEKEHKAFLSLVQDIVTIIPEEDE